MAKKFNMDLHLSALLRDEPFFSYISLQVDKIRNPNIRTLGVTFSEATGRYQLLYNEEFVSSLPPKQILGVLKHEFYHLVFNHVSSKRQENHKMWNIAADLAINSHLVGELPDIAVFPGVGMFEELPEEKTSEWYYQALMANYAEEQVMEISDMDDHEGWGEEGEGAGGGSVSSEIADNKLKEAIKRAVGDCSKTNRWGSVSSTLRKDLIENFITGSVNWRDVLRYFCKTSMRMDKNSTVRKINKRFPYVFPAKKVRRVAKVAISLDQSGSVDDKMLAEFFAEIQNLSRLVDFDLIPFDTAVREEEVVRVKKGQRIEMKRVFAGGTDFDAPTEYVNDRAYDAHIVVTDLGAPTPARSRCKRMWVAPKRVLSYSNFKCDNEKVLGI